MVDRWICRLVASGTVLLTFATSAAPAGDYGTHPPSAKRQLVVCMTKRMTDSKTLSYNDASKVCKEQLAAQRVALATTAVLAKPMPP